MQAITHEKITTTYAVARAVRPTLEHVIALAKRFVATENEGIFRRVHGYVDDRYALDKLFLEILPRLEGVECNFTKVTRLAQRKGDNVFKGTLEIVSAQAKATEGDGATKAIGFPGFSEFKRNVSQNDAGAHRRGRVLRQPAG